MSPINGGQKRNVRLIRNARPAWMPMWRPIHTRTQIHLQRHRYGKMAAHLACSSHAQMTFNVSNKGYSHPWKQPEPSSGSSGSSVALALAVIIIHFLGWAGSVLCEIDIRSKADIMKCIWKGHAHAHTHIRTHISWYACAYINLSVCFLFVTAPVNSHKNYDPEK